MSPFISFFCRNLLSSHFATIPEYRRTPIPPFGMEPGGGGTAKEEEHDERGGSQNTLKQEVPLEIGPRACIENFNPVHFYI